MLVLIIIIVKLSIIQSGTQYITWRNSLGEFRNFRWDEGIKPMDLRVQEIILVFVLSPIDTKSKDLFFNVFDTLIPFTNNMMVLPPKVV